MMKQLLLRIGALALAAVMLFSLVACDKGKESKSTEKPTAQPSVQPSGTPSVYQSEEPSGVPSGEPSGAPSGAPSGGPTEDGLPSDHDEVILVPTPVYSLNAVTGDVTNSASSGGVITKLNEGAFSPALPTDKVWEEKMTLSLFGQTFESVAQGYVSGGTDQPTLRPMYMYHRPLAPDNNYVNFRCFLDPTDEKLTGFFMTDRQGTTLFAQRFEESHAFQSQETFISFANTMLEETYGDDFVTENRTVNVEELDSLNDDGFYIEYRKYIDGYKTNAVTSLEVSCAKESDFISAYSWRCNSDAEYAPFMGFDIDDEALDKAIADAGSKYGYTPMGYQLDTVETDITLVVNGNDLQAYVIVKPIYVNIQPAPPAIDENGNTMAPWPDPVPEIRRTPYMLNLLITVATLVDGNAVAPTEPPTAAPTEPPFSRPTYQYQDTEPATLPPLAPTREGD